MAVYTPRRYKRMHKDLAPTIASSGNTNIWLLLLLLCGIAWLSISLIFATNKLSGVKELRKRESLSRRQLGSQGSVSTSQPNDSPAQTKSAAAVAVRRVSGLGPTLRPNILHGGWQFTRDIYDHPRLHPNATVISEEAPRVVLVKQLLSPEEVQHFIQLAEPSFERSEVVSDDQAVSNVRTSYGTWLNGARRSQTVLNVQHRIAELTGIPEEFGESLYVLRYRQGELYEAHTDHCHHSSSEPLTDSCRQFLQRAGGPGCGPGGGVTCGDRLATVVIYLRTPERGGATVFPYAKRGPASAMRRALSDGEGDNVNAASSSKAVGNSDMAWYCREDAEVLKVLPVSGDAALFFDYRPADGAGGLAVADPASSHAGCPPLEGTKLIATRWIRASQFA